MQQKLSEIAELAKASDISTVAETPEALSAFAARFFCELELLLFYQRGRNPTLEISVNSIMQH